MNNKILNHYLQYSQFTYPGLYEKYLKELPDDIRKIGFLVRKQLIHRTTLDTGNTFSNADLKYGDITRVPWYRDAEDDYFITSAAMLAELYRRDPRGFVEDRSAENKLVLTCRFTAVLMASILKSKGIPARVRSGFASYFTRIHTGKSSDHWINQYWNKEEDRWVTIDIDGSFHDTGFNMYDIPNGKFNFSPDAWLDVRKGKVDEHHFRNDKPKEGLEVIAWELFYDFHCLMNNEIIYIHIPKYIYGEEKFQNLTDSELDEIDNLAKLLQKPDENFKELEHIWNTNKKFRILKGGLL